MSAENARRPNYETITEAKLWDNPELLLGVEFERYPFRRTFSEIVGDVFNEYVPHGATIFEVGSGQAFLRDLIPEPYHTGLIHSDYSKSGIREGKRRRQLPAVVAASATALPLADASVDVIVGLDVYGTLPNLQQAVKDAKRALRPGGTLIHFQANNSDQTVWFDHPDMVFYPTGLGNPRNPEMVGINRDVLQNGLDAVSSPIMREVLAEFLSDQLGSYAEFIQLPLRDKLSQRLLEALRQIPGDKLEVQNIHNYFRTKLRRTAEESGLQVVEAQHRRSDLIELRSSPQQLSPHHNTFSMLYGTPAGSENELLRRQHPHVVIEQANMLVVAAKRP